MAAGGLSVAEKAERGSRRRTRILWMEFVLFTLWQGSFYAWGAADRHPLRLVDQVRLCGLLAWTVALLGLMATGGGWLSSREVRALMNDEGAVANRHEGQRWGFWGAATAGVALYVATLFEALGAMDVLHGVLTAGVGSALGRYAWLERRAERAV